MRNVEEGVAATRALIHEFNATSDKCAEQMDDDEMNRLLEMQCELQTKIATVPGREVDRELRACVQHHSRRRRRAGLSAHANGDLQSILTAISRGRVC